MEEPTYHINSINQLVCGNKAKGLIWLKENGFLVPAFYILDYETLKRFVTKKEILNSELKNWTECFPDYTKKLWSVRSSAEAEDGQTNSYAGQFLTKLNVTSDKIEHAVSEVLESYKLIAANSKYDIIIQEMIQPDFSGVIFTHHPLETTKIGPVINLVPGLGETLVSGNTTAFAAYYDNGNLTTSDLNESYGGLTGTELLDKNKAVIEQLKKSSNSILGLKKNQPIDLEFCIADNKIFWLQIRPMTGIRSGNIEAIWDNTQAEGNFPGLTTPLSISFVQFTLGVSYWNMAKHIGCHKQVLNFGKKYFDNFCGPVNGRLYYNLNSWQYTLYQCPFGKKLSRQLLKTWGVEDTSFQPPKFRNSAIRRFFMLLKFIWLFLGIHKSRKKYERDYKSVLDKFSKIDLTNLSYEDLLKTQSKAESEFGKLWLTPALNGFYLLVFFYLLNKRINRSKIKITHPNFFNDVLYSQEEVISVKLVSEFRNLILTIQKISKLVDYLKMNNSTNFLLYTAQQYPKVHESILNYIKLYGVRTTEGELKIETVNYRENPNLFVDFLRVNIDGKFASRTEKLDWQKLLNSDQSLNFISRWYFKYLVKKTISVVKHRENYRFYRAEVYDLVRKIMRQIDRLLLETGKLENKGDSLYLLLSEIHLPEQSDNFKKIVEKRKNQYLKYEKMIPFTQYHEIDHRFIPVVSDQKIKSSDLIKGVGCCSGVTRGIVKIIHSREDINQDVSGYILVGGNFEPGWINLFSQAAGIISERGNLLSHTAILCRELGIPSIVGAKKITEIVKEGTEILMDGATGEIKIIE